MYPKLISSEDETFGQRLIHSKSEEQAVKEGKIVESANTLQVAIFRTKYFASDLLDDLCNEDYGHLPKFSYMFENANFFKGTSIDQCFNLIESTSADDYRNSEIKWSPAQKKKEMLLPDLRYIILQSQSHFSSTQVAGFTSFMITYEDGHEVIYVYEIHLAAAYRGRGIGKRLMAVVEQTGRNVGVQKAMLTVFRANVGAVKMYRALGYGEDEFTPKARKLRGGVLKEPTYVILSKFLTERPEVVEGGGGES